MVQAHTDFSALGPLEIEAASYPGKNVINASRLVMGSGSDTTYPGPSIALSLVFNTRLGDPGGWGMLIESDEATRAGRVEIRAAESVRSTPEETGLAVPGPRVKEAGAIEALPRGFGLLADCLPLDRRSVEAAFDQLFDQVDDLGADLSGELAPTQPIPRALIVGMAAGAFELGRRYLRRSGQATETKWRALDGSDLDGRPGPWSPRYL